MENDGTMEKDTQKHYITRMENDGNMTVWKMMVYERSNVSQCIKHSDDLP